MISNVSRISSLSLKACLYSLTTREKLGCLESTRAVQYVISCAIVSV